MNEHPPRFESGEPNSHAILDSKDERSIANNLAAAEQVRFWSFLFLPFRVRSFHLFSVVDLYSEENLLSFF